MKKLTLASCLLLIMGGAATLAQEQISTYYPMKPGSKWTYRVGDQPMVLKVVGVDEVDGVKCTILETVANNQKFTEHVAVAADGLYRYKVRIDGMDQKLVPPLRFFKLPPVAGATWEVDSKVGSFGNLRAQGTCRMSEAQVTVPAGSFKAHVSSFDLKQGDQKVSISIYLAPGVGMVKQRMDVGGKEVLIELEKYEEGK